MRLHILSDLHLEFAPFDIPKTNADVVILAGEVHTGKNGMRWIAENLPKVPVVYVLGNHEFYGQKTPTLIQELKQLAKGTNISLLENDSVEIGDTEFMGATLWTDFRLDGAQKAMLLLMPIPIALLAMVTARFTVLRVLGKMP